MSFYTIKIIFLLKNSNKNKLILKVNEQIYTF